MCIVVTLNSIHIIANMKIIHNIGWIDLVTKLSYDIGYL